MVNLNGDTVAEIDKTGERDKTALLLNVMPHGEDTATKARNRKHANMAGAGAGQGAGNLVSYNAEAASKPARAQSRKGDAKSSKTELVLKRLRLSKGATIAMLMETTGWQAHSVHGFLSAVVRKKLRLTLVSEVSKDGARSYRIDDSVKGA